jgi:hypothetical protein
VNVHPVFPPPLVLFAPAKNEAPPVPTMLVRFTQSEQIVPLACEMVADPALAVNVMTFPDVPTADRVVTVVVAEPGNTTALGCPKVRALNVFAPVKVAIPVLPPFMVTLL